MTPRRRKGNKQRNASPLIQFPLLFLMLLAAVWVIASVLVGHF
jgi:hypothetical protein